MKHITSPSPSYNPLLLCFHLLSHVAAHDCCEVVSVTLCAASRGVPAGPQDLTPCQRRVAPLAEHRFSFVQDLAYDMAQFLVSSTATRSPVFQK